MSKSRLYRWAGLVLGTTVLAATAGSCDLQSLVSQILGSLGGTGA